MNDLPKPIPDPEDQKPLSEAQIALLKSTAENLRSTITGLASVCSDIAGTLSEGFDAIKVAMPTTNSYFRTINSHMAKADSIQKAGWLPHYTTPFDLINTLDPKDKLNKTLSEFYKENWQHVKEAMKDRVSQFDINSETKEVFFEALNAHEHEMYRSVCRLLFPEFERVLRIDFPDDNFFKEFASQKELRDFAGSLPAGEGGDSLFLYIKLEDHLYSRVKDHDALKKVSADPVPNRHACIHGLVPYNSFQNSLNTLFMAEYIFWLLNYAKQHQDVQASRLKTAAPY